MQKRDSGIGLEFRLENGQLVWLEQLHILATELESWKRIPDGPAR